jgi:CBS domain-containing protein
MKSGDVMTRHIISIKPDSSIVEAAQLMLTNRISGLPVLNGRGNLVGIVTEGDLLRRIETGTERRRPRWLEFFIGRGRLASEYVHTHGRKISEVMTIEPQTIVEDTPLEEIVTLMEQKRIKRLPVVRGNEVVGIVSRANLLHALASLAPETKGAVLGDANIRERVLAEIERPPWSPGRLINVIVRDGTVELWGTIFDEREREALRVAAENVPGVKHVKDHLIWVEPLSGMTFDASDQVGGQGDISA